MAKTTLPASVDAVTSPQRSAGALLFGALFVFGGLLSFVLFVATRQLFERAPPEKGQLRATEERISAPAAITRPEAPRAWVAPAPTLPIATEAAEAPAAPSPRDAQEERAVLEQEEQRFKEALAVEARDSAWAGRAERSLRSTLEAAAAGGAFEIEALECKTTMCAASVKFSDRASARRNFPRTLHARYSPNCGTSILLPRSTPEEDPDHPVRAQLQFQCDDARIAEAAEGK